jgi:hypothetical protein
MLLPYLKGVPWQRFMEFISPEADRLTILKETLKEAALEYRVTEIAGSRHIIVTPPQEHLKSMSRRPPTILVAHYDRAEGSPGANDNSAGVFLLVETAMKLIKKNEVNWLVIFTDREELKPGGKIQSQGSYGLAEGLKNLRMEKAKIFSFDACGTGDTLVISTTLESLLKKEGAWEKLKDTILELRQFALDTARNLNMAKVLLAPAPFSDDAGFIRAGLVAQTVTMLPSGECIQLVAELRKNPDFSEALISAKMRQAGRLQSIPDTWRSLNTPTDSHLRLTPENFRTVVRFAEALCSG